MFVHNLDPFALQISGDFGIRWYGLSYMAGFVFSYYLITWLVNRQRAGVSAVLVGDLVTYAAIGTLLGGRLGYCLFYSPDLFLKFKPEFPFWGVLAVNEGGMASHGGIIGIILACLWFARNNKLNFLYLLDLVATVGPIGVFMGRVANFINGELVGREAPADFKYAVKFPSDIFNWPSQSPQLLNGLSDVVDKIGLNREQWLSWCSQFSFNTAARQNIYDGLTKIVFEIQNGNEAARAAIEPLLVSRYPSQLIAAVLEGLLTFIILFFLWRKSRKPGFIAGSFVIIYSIVRIINENFRMPDAHVGFQALGLTRGQWLSVGMLSIGVIWLLIWTRSNYQKIPGWGKGQNIKLMRK